MMKHAIFRSFPIGYALWIAACDLPAKDVGETLGHASSGSSGEATASATSGGDGPGASSGNGGEGPSGTSGGPIPDVGNGELDTGGASSPDLGSGASDGASTGGNGVTACDPVLQDCSGADGCYLDGTAFACLPVAADPGALGSACAAPNDCQVGLVCIDVCIRVCQVGGDGCDVGQSCVPFYADGEAPVGLEQVGLCT